MWDLIVVIPDHCLSLYFIYVLFCVANLSVFFKTFLCLCIRYYSKDIKKTERQYVKKDVLYARLCLLKARFMVLLNGLH